MENLICVSGPRGAGKELVVNSILDCLGDRFTRILPFTTREKRISETHGKEYAFISQREYQELKTGDDILFEVSVGDYYSGTLKSEFNRHKNAIVDITVDGARQLCRHSLNYLNLFIYAPKSMRCQRIMNRQGISMEEALSIMENEPSPGNLENLNTNYSDFLILHNEEDEVHIKRLSKIVVLSFLKASVFK